MLRATKQRPEKSSEGSANDSVYGMQPAGNREAHRQRNSHHGHDQPGREVAKDDAFPSLVHVLVTAVVEGSQIEFQPVQHGITSEKASGGCCRRAAPCAFTWTVGRAKESETHGRGQTTWNCGGLQALSGEFAHYLHQRCQSREGTSLSERTSRHCSRIRHPGSAQHLRGAATPLARRCPVGTYAGRNRIRGRASQHKRPGLPAPGLRWTHRLRLTNASSASFSTSSWALNGDSDSSMRIIEIEATLETETPHRTISVISRRRLDCPSMQ